MDNQKNTILAVVLSGLVLLGWQYFFANPQLEKQRQIQTEQAQKRAESSPAPATPGTAPQQQQAQAPNVPQPPGQPGTQAPSTTAPAQPASRDSVIAASPRVKISTPTLAGSISLNC